MNEKRKETAKLGILGAIIIAPITLGISIGYGLICSYLFWELLDEREKSDKRTKNAQ